MGYFVRWVAESELSVAEIARAGNTPSVTTAGKAAPVGPRHLVSVRIPDGSRETSILLALVP